MERVTLEDCTNTTALQQCEVAHWNNSICKILHTFRSRACRLGSLVALWIQLCKAHGSQSSHPSCFHPKVRVQCLAPENTQENSITENSEVAGHGCTWELVASIFRVFCTSYWGCKHVSDVSCCCRSSNCTDQRNVRNGIAELLLLVSQSPTLTGMLKTSDVAEQRDGESAWLWAAIGGGVECVSRSEAQQPSNESAAHVLCLTQVYLERSFHVFHAEQTLGDYETYQTISNLYK